MTIKKNYEKRDSIELRKPKSRIEETRESTRFKARLRHGDLSVLDEDELEELGERLGYIEEEE